MTWHIDRTEGSSLMYLYEQNLYQGLVGESDSGWEAVLLGAVISTRPTKFGAMSALLRALGER